MDEFTLASNIQNKFLSINDINKLLTEFISEFINLNDDCKSIYADTYLLQITNCFLKLSNTELIQTYIHFLESTNIIKFCSYAMLENYISNIYNSVINNKNYIELYQFVISLFLQYSFYTFIDDHLVNFYTHPQVYNLNIFVKIEKYLKHSSIQRLLYQNIRRNNNVFIYYIVFRYQRYFDKSINVDDTNISLKLNEVIETIQTYKTFFNDYTSLCRDEYNIILEYLF